MTMVHKLRRQRNLASIAGAVVVVVLTSVSRTDNVSAAPPWDNYNHTGTMKPGAIGSQQLLRGGPLPGYFQPVELRGPQGVTIATAAYGEFEAPRPGPLAAGLLIGAVYRLRVTNIPGQEGLEVFPTIEVIDRLFPPVGQEFNFPIPIELSQDEIEMALAGKFVTRVIYLEEPTAALPVAETPDEQSCFEVTEHANPIEVVRSMGRPMAILRMGGRLPTPGQEDDTFLFGSPPMLKWKPNAANRAMDSAALSSSRRSQVQPAGTARGIRQAAGAR